MAAGLSLGQERALLASAVVHRAVDVAETWVVTRLGVLVDARVAGVREVAAQHVMTDLAHVVGSCSRARLACSTHGPDRAPAVLTDMRTRLAAGRTPLGWQLVLNRDDDLDVAAKHLAAHPHGALVVAVALCDGRALAAAWS